MSKLLWCVIKGRAAAPPGIGCSIGVSTSKYPDELKKSRIALNNLVRFTKTSLTLGLTTKSA